MPSWRVVLQSRISSARLPAKAMLPVGGIPLAVLAALRAANLGADVVLATSVNTEDDVLVRALAAYDIRIVRGSLDNVLDRFLAATADMALSDIVVRLTADNIFPDGEFVAALVQQFISSDVDYLGTHSPLDGLPYGLSAEVFSVRMLREAASHATTDAEREHVTPWIRSNGICAYTDAAKLGLRQRYDYLRATVDNLNDYLRMANLFAGIGADPCQVGWRILVETLDRISDNSLLNVPQRIDATGRAASILTLGTVQLGMRYGRANTTGQPSFAEAERILRLAIGHGITDIDTARAYGASEQSIGRVLRSGLQGSARLITKLDPLSALQNDASREQVGLAVDASVFRSCRELGVARLDVLLLHRWEHRRQCDGAIWDRLLGLRAEGVVSKLGASVSSPEEAVEALLDGDVQHIQLPCNVLDWRWEKPEFLSAIAARPDVDIHVRSAFLQGILLSSPEMWPPGLVDSVDYVNRLDRLVTELGRESRADLCLAYLSGTEWINSIVIGVETEEQLKRNLALARRAALSSDEKLLVRQVLDRVPTALLNPAAWTAKKEQDAHV